MALEHEQDAPSQTNAPGERQAVRDPDAPTPPSDEVVKASASALRKKTKKKKEDPLIGRTVGGRYTITSRIGAGGMGVVYKAKQGAVDRDIAVKVLLPERLGEADDVEELVRRFHLEARAASKLAHPNSITIYDFGQDEDGLLYIAMEYLQGSSLEQVLRKGAMEPSRVAKVMMQICSSLAEAHNKGIIHRDIKPDNIFLIQMGGEQDFVKVLDFGVAKLRGPAKEKTLTKAGMIFGTPKYMSPEQARCQTLDARSDIYALGVMMYQMLIGQVPFDADDHVSILLMHCSDPPPPFGKVRQDMSVPQELTEIAFKALEKDRGKRFQSVEEMQSALEVVAARFNYVSATGLLPTVSPSSIQPVAGVPTPAPTSIDTLGNQPVINATPSAPMNSLEASDTPSINWDGDLKLDLATGPHKVPSPIQQDSRGPNMMLVIGGAVLAVMLLIGGVALFVSGPGSDEDPKEEPAPVQVNAEDPEEKPEDKPEVVPGEDPEGKTGDAQEAAQKEGDGQDDPGQGDPEEPGKDDPAAVANKDEPQGKTPTVDKTPPGAATGQVEKQTPSPASEVTLRISSVPAGASVSLGGKSLGLTPLNLKQPKGGSLPLTITKAGYKPYSRSLSLGKNQRVNARLRLVAAAKPDPTPTKVTKPVDDLPDDPWKE